MCMQGNDKEIDMRGAGRSEVIMVATTPVGHENSDG